MERRGHATVSAPDAAAANSPLISTNSAAPTRLPVCKPAGFSLLSSMKQCIEEHQARSPTMRRGPCVRR